SFGVMIDAVPGRVNETWFKAERTGTFYGNCRELCGVDHAFMPIEIRVVSQPEFDAWVASKGGKTAAQIAAAKAGAAAAAAAPPAAAEGAGQPAAATAPATTAAPGAAPAAPNAAAPAPAAPAAN